MSREEINEVVQAAADAHAVTVEDLTSDRRFAEFVSARVEAAVMLKRRGLKQSTIARLLQLDHSTIKRYLRRRRREVVELQREVA